MEKLSLNEHNSFNKTCQIPSRPTTLHPSSLDDASYKTYSRKYSRGEDHELSSSLADRRRIFGDFDRFTNTLLEMEDKLSGPPETPDFVETLSKMIESKLEAKRKLGDEINEEDMFFMDAIAHMSRLTNALSQFPSYATKSPTLNITSTLLQRAMAFLEEEFQAMLEDTSSWWDQDTSFRKVLSSQEECSDRCVLHREADCAESDGDSLAYSAGVMAKMNKIATTMVSGGYETECCQVYSVCRRNAIRQQMERLEFEKINIDDVVKMPWESLEGEISRWIRVVKFYSQVVFPGEKKLGELVFSEHPEIWQSHFGNLARAVVIQLLDFAEAVAMAKRSAEKLFKFLDLYETLRDRVGEAAASIFCNLENSIKSDAARTPVPGGAVHPLTRYVMNYLKYAGEYKDTLEKIFQKHWENEKYHSNDHSDHCGSATQNEASGTPSSRGEAEAATPFCVQVVRVMELLDANLEEKSNLYRDPSLRHIFLMNNGRYILQKVKGCAEIRGVMGDTWCRRRSTVVRQYHKNYQRETWSRVLQCLNQDGSLQMNGGKVNKAVMKERIKTFSTIFDEIHRTQSSWMVSDEQLQSELRVSISAVVIPAYRSFIGRFRQALDNGKQADKYIKYQPEDIEAMIEDLFEGSTTSMSSRRRL
ncbi:exocyst complex component 7-like [Dorcoceras hygrometricum]|uniref:Exocyst subunit Exo70 family protein n=1 Tax=Dorcoceras hygrometricum TaxID=472368 RepID=A0A2Z7CWL8_9LAMI|nr:exocyst complex component 7-like [Dorcoceras hygrometricum]